ncbi:transcriptional regulator [Kitasatospora sp. NPDC028055]|uniref:transcriptional regulator n=1 Tax=Kitasatospora sp. NPDC028055 TaxID=3155653 RepID=UPI0033CDD9CE
MPRSIGNTALKAARQARGLSSQQALASALHDAARQLGLGEIVVSRKQIGRWESPNPPWPRDDHQQLLTYVLRLPIEDLGFRAPWDDSVRPGPDGARPLTGRRPSAAHALPRPAAASATQPPTVGADFAAVTEAHRRLYWSVPPATLHQAVAEHANLGAALLAETDGIARRVLASALAESLLLAGRIQFFDLRQPEVADATFVRALQAAGEADDPLLGAAVLGHSAFVPGWAGHREDTAERMRAARTYARRGPASAELLAWLDAVEAECLTRCGDHRQALTILRRAEETMSTGGEHRSPEWFTWFSSTRLAAFKGNTELAAGLIPQARTTLEAVLADLPETAGKQRVVVLGDLAAVEAAARRPDAACALLEQALDQLGATWYATGMERIREARRALASWQDSDSVRRVDDRLYSWAATLSSLQR